MASIKEEREAFAASPLPDQLAEQAGVATVTRLLPRWERSARFVWYRDEVTLTLVVGAQEAGYVEEALAVGLGVRGDRELRLVLPRGWEEPTLHRWAWLRDDLPMRVWSYHSATARAETRPSRTHTLGLVSSAEKPMLHLRDRTSWVESLMRWAGDQADLDPSHRQDVRAWQCRGQRVLRIRRVSNGLEILAGIDWGTSSPNETPTPLLIHAPLSWEQQRDLQDLVTSGCQERLTGVAQKADEHWLQAVLRRHPSVLGLESPVLRELPAWRPSGSLGTKQPTARGRGFVDLAGLDATGTLLLVETKLGGDHMLVLQGLDYRTWAEANRARLTSRLDCRPDVPIEIAYCVGGKNGGPPAWSPYTKGPPDLARA
jgi:hypothetical protein